MKIILIALFLVVSSTDLFGQRYKTLGIAQYQKDLTGKYRLINKILDYEAAWSFNTDNTYHCYQNWENCGDYPILKKTKVGAKVTYLIKM